MNRFRVNLHPAFFADPEVGSDVQESPEAKFERELNDLKAPILEEFSTATNNFLNDVNQNQEQKILSRYRDSADLRSDQKRFFERINSEAGGKKYSEIWNEKITAGFGALIRELKDNKYFEGKDIKAETARIKEMYWNEVKQQYIDNVWFAGNKKFDAVKNTLFGYDERTMDLSYYPANKIYCELTGATTIVKLNKTKVTTYDVDPQHESQEGDEEVDSATTKQRINFLAHDLPNYLWEVKDKTALQSLLGWTPIIRSSVDAASLEDKKQLEKFIKAVDKLEGENVELTLIKVFDNLESNATEDQIKQALKDNNLTLKKDKYIKHIKRAFEFYSSTQSVDNSVRNQHALYLSILQIVQKQGGFDKAISAFQKEVSDYTAKQDEEGKEYRKGKKLDENYKAFAERLGFQDFTSATRLSEKGQEYFQNTDIVDILADINNDGAINFADRGVTKTGAQFKEIYNMVGEDVALPNLLAQAKMVNGTLTNNEGMAIPDGEFTAEQIKAGNKKLILMLQSIISNPGQDLRTLMLYGPDAAKRNGEMYEVLQNAPESADDPRVQAVVQEKLKDLDTSNLKIDGVEVASAEGLHQAASGALYAEYMRGVGLGGRISFEEWAKGLSLNGGIQVSEKGVSIGLNLAYSREIDLGKGWSMTPGASVGFIPMFKFGDGFAKPEWSGSAGVELAKKWISEHSVENKIGLRLSFTEVFGVAHVYSAFVGWERDKASGIEKDRPNMKREFNTKVITPLLDGIAENFKDKEFDLTVPENSILVEVVVDKIVEDLLKGDKGKFTDEDIKRLKENTVRYLINYNKAPIGNEKVRQQIADEMAENYSYAWAEQRLRDIDGKTYLSGANIGASWVQIGSKGVPLIHAGLGFKTQSIDIYGDGGLSSQVVEALSGSTWDQEKINYFNNYLLVSPEGKFKLEGGYIVIPAKAITECDIRINSGMKGLIKKDESGNVLLSPETFMNLPDVLVGTARKSTKVLIGGGNEADAVKIQDVLKDPTWFTDGDIDTTKLTGKENLFTKESLASALNDLKVKLPDDQDLQAFNFDDAILSQLEKGKKYKITLEKTGSGISQKVEEVTSGDPLQIEYISAQEVGEMMKENAQEIARKAYSEALKVTSNRLYLISHEVSLGGKKSHKWPEYVNFANAVKDKDYNKAKEIIVAMLPKMDSYINKGQGNNKVNFSAMIDDLNKITDDVELGQAMLSINNIFARVSSVQGGTDGKYHFKKYEKGRVLDRQIGEIIGMRAGEIERKINGSTLSQDAKDAYNGLIHFAEKYRSEHADKYKDTSRKGEILHNAVGINLGNSINIENPLFNPEVYEGSIIEGDEFNFEGKDALQERAMRTMATDKSLMGPVLSALNIDPNSQIGNMTYENGKLSIDINGKNVILSAEMKFGYFAQCVNHMLLLDNINAEIPGEGASVNFGPSVMGNGAVREGVKRSLVRTSKTGFELTVAIKQEEPEQENEEAETEMGGGKVKPETPTPETTPVVIEYDENGNPINPPVVPETPTPTPPVATESDPVVVVGGGGRS